MKTIYVFSYFLTFIPSIAYSQNCCGGSIGDFGSESGGITGGLSDSFGSVPGGNVAGGYDNGILGGYNNEIPRGFSSELSYGGFGSGRSSRGYDGSQINTLGSDIYNNGFNGYPYSLNQRAFASKLINPAFLPYPGTITDFVDFLLKTGKRFSSPTELSYRERIFLAHQETANRHNQYFQTGQSAYELGVNFFSDLNTSEVLMGLTGRRRNSRSQASAKNARLANSTYAGIPDSFDWRLYGGVTQVKFQGLECGACWAFAVTGAIEGHVFRKTGQLIDLSEQNLVDCSTSYGNSGCDGGYHDYGFEYVTDNKCISRAEFYPYTEKQATCKFNQAFCGSEIKGYAMIPPGNETLIKEVIATLGPVAASINAEQESFQLYKGGIYSDKECNKGELNHMILIVGYGTENGQDYWIIKNSWTEKWGEDGYMRLLHDFCGVTSEASYPIV